MAKSEFKPGVNLTRIEKKRLHKIYALAVIPRGRRKYQSSAFKVKQLIKSAHNDPRPVDWSAIASKPGLFAPGGDGLCVSNPRLPGKATALQAAKDATTNG